MDYLRISCYIAFALIPQDPADDKSTFARRHQAITITWANVD